ncbi:MAG: glycosyltransferase family 2 protein [Ardenticatenia bacterium]|nr:glycosyltransferase family 2 protein [Ardenticatenia bacterium]
MSPLHSKPPPPGTLAVVIVSYNTRDLLAHCLDSLRLELDAAGIGAEVQVVDNASSDGSAAMVAERFPWVQLTALADNRGFTAGNNVVLGPLARGQGASPDWVLLLNPDTEVRPGALQTLLDAAAEDPRIAVAGPALVYPDDGFQHAAFAFPGIAQAALDLFPPRGRLGRRLLESRLNGRYPRRRYRAGKPFNVDFVLGACMLVRVAALRQVGPLDEGYFMYAEEVDWCRRFARAGWRVVCAPAATVMHHGGAASGQFRARSWSILWRSRRRYLRLHEPAWRADVVDLLLKVAVAQLRRADERALAAGSLSGSEAQERRTAYAAALGPMDDAPPQMDAPPMGDS